MIREVLLIHHSHTDIGYTHSQPVVLELHKRFIEEALDFCDTTQDWPDDCKFKWTCEVTGITAAWWRQASETERKRFLSASNRGQIEVAGLQWNITPLIDDTMLVKLLAPALYLRKQGIQIKSAMNSDVNGAPWGMIDALLDFGIDSLSMGVNEHYGYAPQPRPRGFWWESPSGRKLLIWNGLQYWNAANIQMRIPESLEAVAQAMPPYLKIWEDRGYPYSYLPVQITTASSPDNASPDPNLPHFVRNWNNSNPSVRLRLVTLSEIFDLLRKEESLPTLRGDWTDWWNFGSGSTARETTLTLEGQRLLGVADQLRTWPGISFPREETQFDQARNDLALFAEHTWGSDRSVSIPDSIETVAELGLKSAYAYRGYLQARMLRRDGLERLAKFAGGDEMTALIYNPLPYPIRRTVRIPLPGSEFEYISEPRLQHNHRQDIIFDDQPDTNDGKKRFQWIGPIDIPSLGFVTVSCALKADVSSSLKVDEQIMENEHIRISFAKDRLGILSLIMDGDSYSNSDAQYLLGEPVLERPLGNQRGEIFGPLDWRALDVHEQWRPDWEAVRETAVQLIESHYALKPNCAEYEQSGEMSNGDIVNLTYRLFPEARGVDLTVTIQKTPQKTPHSLYLPIELDLEPKGMICHYTTAGAVVELDREQIPYSSKHYITTQNFIRLEDKTKGVTVSCPDAPLWQVGGFTFGRHKNGEVAREKAMLAAWLANNYWDVNFNAAQSGSLRFRFTLLPHKAESIEESAREGLCHAVQPQVHIFRNRGALHYKSAQLLDLELNGAIVTQMEPSKSGIVMTLLNPSDKTLSVSIAPGVFIFDQADRTDIAGSKQCSIPLENGTAKSDIPPRAWLNIELKKIDIESDSES